MPTEAIVAFELSVEYAAYPTPAGYTAIAEVRKCETPKLTAGKAPATNYDTSGPDRTLETVPGWKAGGSLALEANYIDTEYAALDAIQAVQKTWRITLDDGATFVFAGHIEDLGLDIPEAGTDQVVITKATLFVDGAVAFTPGS